MTGTANKTDTQGSHTHRFLANYAGNNSTGMYYAAATSGTFWWSGRIESNGNHSHNIYLGSDDTETKPSNFTKKLWVRTN